MSLRCRNVEDLFIEASDGALKGEALVAHEQHVASCEACREASQRWKRWTARARAVEPAPLPELALRRMERDLLRVKPLAAETPRPPRRWLGLGLGLAGGLAALLLVVLRPWPSTVATKTAAPAVVSALVGQVLRAGRPLGPQEPLALGDTVSVAPGGGLALTLSVPTASQISVSGPAELVLAGGANATELWLSSGTLHAEVTPLGVGQAFAVLLNGVRVEVRGTAFTVGYDERGHGWLEVAHGRVVVKRGGHASLSVEPATGHVSFAPPPPESAAAAPVRDELPASHASPSLEKVASGPTCVEREHRCVAGAEAVRLAMRRRDASEALRLIAEVDKGAAVCGRRSACQDELRYLRAEALRSSGQDEAALAAFKSLGLSGGPGSMRQNALYAAGDLAVRLGRPADAIDAYERALAAAPRGALREESLAGAFRAAAAARDPRARSMAARYLAAFPHGWAAREAARVAGVGSDRGGEAAAPAP